MTIQLAANLLKTLPKSTRGGVNVTEFTENTQSKENLTGNT